MNDPVVTYITPNLTPSKREELDSMIWNYGVKRAEIEVNLNRMTNTIGDTPEEARYIEKERARAEDKAMQAHNIKEEIIAWVDDLL